MTTVTSAAVSTEYHPVQVGRLTDEELVLLDAEHPLVQLPHLTALPDSDQLAAVASALRSLVARGFDYDRSGQVVQLPRDLNDALDVRAGAAEVLCVQILRPPNDERPTPEMVELYAFVVDDIAVLEEVSDHGVHDLWVVAREDLSMAMQERVPSVGVRDGRGDPFRVDLASVAAGREDVILDCIGTPVAQLDATVWRAPATERPMLLAVLFGSAGCCSALAAVDAEGEQLLRPTRVADVGEQVVQLLTRPDTMLR